MPQTLANGGVVPINSDAYNLAPDLATMGNSLNVIIAVVSQAARDALTTATGLTVTRQDLGGQFQTWTGSAWASSAGTETIDVSTTDTNWAFGTRLTRAVSADGALKQVIMAFFVIRNAGPNFNILAASENSILSGLVPSGWRPTAQIYGNGICSGPTFGGLGLYVSTSGDILTRSTGSDTTISAGSRITGTVSWKTA